MTSEPNLTRYWLAIVFLSLLTGAFGGFIGGMFIDRDRNAAAPAIIEYFDMRTTSKSYDVELNGNIEHVTAIKPREVEEGK